MVKTLEQQCPDGIYPVFHHQGNFTVCLLYSDTGEYETADTFAGLGVTKRAPEDEVDYRLARTIALGRALARFQRETMPKNLPESQPPESSGQVHVRDFATINDARAWLLGKAPPITWAAQQPTDWKGGVRIDSLALAADADQASIRHAFRHAFRQQDQTIDAVARTVEAGLPNSPYTRQNLKNARLSEDVDRVYTLLAELMKWAFPPGGSLG